MHYCQVETDRVRICALVPLHHWMLHQLFGASEESADGQTARRQRVQQRRVAVREQRLEELVVHAAPLAGKQGLVWLRAAGTDEANSRGLIHRSVVLRRGVDDGFLLVGILLHADGDPEPAEHGEGHAPVDNDGNDDNDEGGGQNYLPATKIYEHLHD